MSDAESNDIPALLNGVLNTNYIPSPEEEGLIRQAIIPRHVQRLQDLDARVLEARRVLEQLTQEQRREKEMLQAHRALLSPMRRLIPDILLDIFHLCQERNYEMPMYLAAVCRRWRDLVTSTPTLWSVVLLHDGMRTERIVPYTRACVKYSQSLPLKVVLKFLRRRVGLATCRKAIKQALGILEPHHSRWRVYHCFVDSSYKLHGDLKLPGVAPLLEELVHLMQTAGETWGSLYQSSDIPMLTQCKTLRRFSIDDNGAGLSLRDCWEILTHCRNLQHFETLRLKTDSEAIPRDEVEMPDLRVLCLGPMTLDPSQLIHNLKTPSLEHLRLLIGQDTLFDSSCLSRLFSDSRPPVQTLSLVNADGHVLSSILPLLPQLSTLTLQHGNNLDALVRRLTERANGDDFFCPRLAYFALRLCIIRGSSLVRFAKERKVAGRRIFIHVDGKIPVKKKEFPWLTITLAMVVEFSDAELKELRDLHDSLLVGEEQAKSGITREEG